jgi:hypothetical protein
MSIILNLRDGTLIIPKKYYESYLNIDWFLSGLINFSEYNDDNENTYTLWEDKAAVLTLFDSLKFQKLTLHKDISLDYLENLADMWCAPQWITESIKERKLYAIDENKYPNNNDINNHVFKCINCSTGYKIKENTNTSCNFHNNSFNSNSGNYICCQRDHNDEPCIIGYHCTSSYDYNLIYNKLNNI